MSDTEEVYFLEEDDLEEGEITDDSDIQTDTDTEVIITDVKPKKLPKRYTLHERKVSNEKHCKKACKHAHYSNHKIKDRNKSTLSNVEYRKHKSSCPLQRQKSSMKKVVSKKHAISPSHSKPLNNQNSSFKSAFRNYTSPPRPVLPKTSPISNGIGDDISYPELLLAYKITREHFNYKRKSSDFDNQHESPSKKSTTHLDESSFLKCIKNEPPIEKNSPTKIDVKRHVSETIIDIADENEQFLIDNSPVPETIEVQEVQEIGSSPIEENVVEDDEESEDEEELRRIALATLAGSKASENGSTTTSPTHSLSNQSSVTLIVNGNNSSDNHEVIDMDLDEEDFVEDVHNNLFVIDNQPVMPSEFNPYMFYGNSYMNGNLPTENYLPYEQEPHFLTSLKEKNEDVEEAILRAEVLASMNTNTIALPNYVPDKSPELENMSESFSPPDPFCKSPFYYEGHSFNSVEATVNKIEVVKLSNSKFLHSKALVPKPRNINATQNRLIITLNNDSSSEESDATEDSDEMSKQENVVASIDALISSARQKSDIKTNGTHLNNVSCLSKAQQEEYTKLRNILAEKEPMANFQQVAKEEVAKQQQRLNFIANKINAAKKKLNKEEGVLCNTEKEVQNKKKAYISSKLKFQHLQEQLHAAELTKTANLKAWKVYEAKLVNTKSVVSKQKALISMLETELNNKRLQLEQNSSSPLIQ